MTVAFPVCLFAQILSMFAVAGNTIVKDVDCIDCKKATAAQF